MRVAVDLSVQVDEQAWAEQHGIPVERVRDDIRLYLRNALKMHSGSIGEVRINNHRRLSPMGIQ